MPHFSIGNVVVSAPTRWQARKELEKIFDRDIFYDEIIKEDDSVIYYSSYENMRNNVPRRYW